MKLVIIDRDGVINEELPHYVKSVGELVILKPALEGIALLAQKGFTIAVATNQSCVGRGIISAETLEEIHAFMRAEIRRAGGEIHAVFTCTDHPDKATFRRKPGAGMLVEAMEQFEALPESTPFIGDAVTDLQAAHAAGCPRFLVMTGKGKKTLASIPESLNPVTPCPDLLGAARKIVEIYG